jgi:tRNA (guanine37-N1)-methyltransferase
MPLEIEILTLFPRMVALPLRESILGKAQEKGLLSVRARDIRDYAAGKHRVTDDTQYGGGAGMVMKVEPLAFAIEAAKAAMSGPARTILLDPAGKPFSQRIAEELLLAERFILICGRYEGFDERIRAFADEEISMGDFILTGGEFGALCIVDACARLVPGVLGNEVSPAIESFSEGVLEYPQYTRPPEFQGQRVPPILLSGDHAKIARWRRKQALLRTRARRPDLFERLLPHLLPEDLALLADGESGLES